MKINEIAKLLKTSTSIIYNYFKKGILRRTKLYNGKYDYNADDVKKIINNQKIVLIDPKKQCIYKIYNNINEVVKNLNLKVEKRAILTCLNNKKNTVGGYILKYKRDVTPENIIIYSQKCNRALDGTKKCSKCKEWKTLDESIKNTICINCRIKIRDNVSENLNVFFKPMAGHMRGKSKLRFKKGKNPQVFVLLMQNSLKNYIKIKKSVVIIQILK